MCPSKSVVTDFLTPACADDLLFAAYRLAIAVSFGPRARETCLSRRFDRPPPSCCKAAHNRDPYMLNEDLKEPDLHQSSPCSIHDRLISPSSSHPLRSIDRVSTTQDPGFTLHCPRRPPCPCGRHFPLLPCQGLLHQNNLQNQGKLPDAAGNDPRVHQLRLHLQPSLRPVLSNKVAFKARLLRQELASLEAMRLPRQHLLFIIPTAPDHIRSGSAHGSPLSNTPRHVVCHRPGFTEDGQESEGTRCICLRQLQEETPEVRQCATLPKVRSERQRGKL